MTVFIMDYMTGFHVSSSLFCQCYSSGFCVSLHMYNINRSGTMPQNSRPKIPPYVVFLCYMNFVLLACCKKVFVCVLYFLCFRELTFYQFFYSNFLKLNAKWVFNDTTIFLIWAYYFNKIRRKATFDCDL